MAKTLLHITTRAICSPVESGKRATAKGYKPIKLPLYITGTWRYKCNYTGLFFSDGSHMTWCYGKGEVFPDGVKYGDEGKVYVVGEYSDKEVSCFVVTFNGIKTQI